ncbi:MAG: lytic transglycosylase domain-containing protein [Pseudomonadota bacterium]
MIGRIDPHTLSRPGKPLLSKPGQGFDFETVLKTCMEGEKTEPNSLDQLRINLLSRAIDALLSENTSDDSGAFRFSCIPSLASAPASDPPGETPVVSNKAQTTSQNFEPVVEEAAAKYGVDPKLVKAVIAAESGGNPCAVSPVGAQGLMQLMPSTGADLGVKNPFDPVQNIMAGTRYLRTLIDRYHGNTRLALAAYNWGMGNLEKRPESLPKETRAYIARVERNYNSTT